MNWAIEKAREIHDDARKYKYSDAIELIAAKLEMIKHEGRIEGVQQASVAINKTFEKTS